MTITESHWNEHENLITTRISGLATAKDVARWETSLLMALNQLPENSVFKIMIDLHGFKAVNFDVHKQFRVVIPKTLANYDWRVGYLDLFPEAQINLKRTRGIRCVAAVHVHHDESKIRTYDLNHSRHNERFFTDPVAARQWISAFDITNQTAVHS